MKKQLADKTIVVSGTAKGIGYKMIETFAQNGANVFALARNETTEHSKYCERLSEEYQEYIDAVTKLLPVWMCPVLLVLDVVCGIIGGWIGTKVLKKHFEKAGIT